MGRVKIIENILFLSEIIDYNLEDINISKMIFHKLHEIKNYSLDQLAESLNISNYTLKKYIQNFGYHTYSEFKEDILYEINFSSFQLKKIISEENEEKLLENLDSLHIDMSDIENICHDLYNSQNIYILGSPYLLCLSTKFSLNMKLMKKTVLNNSSKKVFSNKITSQDMAIILSPFGVEFYGTDGGIKEIMLNKHIKKWIISNSKPFETEHYISVDSKTTTFSIDTLIVNFFNLLSIKYYKMYGKESL